MASKRTNKGFSLVELLVAIGIIALLATIGTIAATSFARKAKEQKTRAYMDMLMSAILTYQESTGMYPNANIDEWREANDTNSGSTGNLYFVLAADPSAFDKVKQMPGDAFDLNTSGQAYRFKDGWGNPLYYNARGGMGGTPALWSAGADGIMTTAGVTTASNTAIKDDIYSYRK